MLCLSIIRLENTADLGTETLRKRLFYKWKNVQEFPKVSQSRVLVLGGMSIDQHRHHNRARLNHMITHIIVAIVLAWDSIILDHRIVQSSSSRSSSDIEIEIAIGDRYRAILNVIVSAIIGPDRARVLNIAGT